MGVTYRLVDHSKKEYIDLGKKCGPPEHGYQITDAKVLAFLRTREIETPLVVIPDCYDDDDPVSGNGYTCLGSWSDPECLSWITE